MLSPRPRSTVSDLLRLAAAWLAAVVLVQGVAAALALGMGPLHVHRPDGAHAPGLEQRHHDTAERHVHAAFDASAQFFGPAGDLGEGIDGTAFALTAALALMAIGATLARPADTRRHVWRAAPVPGWRSTTPALALKPPRPA
jgi:hypothetical protein